MKEIKYTEQALQAWMSAEPNGIVLPFSRLHIAISHLKLELSSAEVIAIFHNFVDTDEENIPFLVFWKAYSHLSRMEDPRSIDEDEHSTGFLFLELETFRDSLLRFYATQKTDFPLTYLYSEIDKTKKMSEHPAFWENARTTIQLLESNAKNIEKVLEEKMISMGEATMTLISLLLDAITFARDLENKELKKISEQAEIEQKQLERRRMSEEKNVGLPVFVHVYDVSQEDSIRKLNKFTANKFSPLKFGGVFHAGVEVADLEWSYGASTMETVPGIVCHEKKTHPQHRYRQTIFMGHTKMPKEDIADMISDLVEGYPGWDYDLLRRNCCHFADDMCLRLGVGRIPGWIYRFARVGAGLDTMYAALKSLGGNSSAQATANTAANLGKQRQLELTAA